MRQCMKLLFAFLISILVSCQQIENSSISQANGRGNVTSFEFLKDFEYKEIMNTLDSSLNTYRMGKVWSDKNFNSFLWNKKGAKEFKSSLTNESNYNFIACVDDNRHWNLGQSANKDIKKCNHVDNSNPTSIGYTFFFIRMKKNDPNMFCDGTIEEQNQNCDMYQAVTVEKSVSLNRPALYVAKEPIKPKSIFLFKPNEGLDKTYIQFAESLNPSTWDSMPKLSEDLIGYSRIWFSKDIERKVEEKRGIATAAGSIALTALIKIAFPPAGPAAGAATVANIGKTAATLAALSAVLSTTAVALDIIDGISYATRLRNLYFQLPKGSKGRQVLNTLFILLKYRWVLDIANASVSGAKILNKVHEGLVVASIKGKYPTLQNSDFTGSIRQTIRNSAKDLTTKNLHQSVTTSTEELTGEVIASATSKGADKIKAYQENVKRAMELGEKTLEDFDAKALKSVGLALDQAQDGYEIKSLGKVKPNTIIAGTTAFGGTHPPILVSENAVKTLTDSFKSSKEYQGFNQLPIGQQLLRMRNFIRDNAFNLTEYTNETFNQMLANAGSQIDLSTMLKIGHADCRGHAAAFDALITSLEKQKLLSCDRFFQGNLAYLGAEFCKSVRSKS